MIDIDFYFTKKIVGYLDTEKPFQNKKGEIIGNIFKIVFLDKTSTEICLTLLDEFNFGKSYRTDYNIFERKVYQRNVENFIKDSPFVEVDNDC